MVKILKIGTTNKRKPKYYTVVCPHCGAELTFEYGDVWIEDVETNTGRIECPSCRTKVFVAAEGFAEIVMAKECDEEIYNSASTDTSKRGIIELLEEKQKNL